MGVALKQVGPANSHALQNHLDAIGMLCPRDGRVDERLRKRPANLDPRIQGVERILEDELCLPAEVPHW
jgi:hypothetical protein